MNEIGYCPALTACPKCSGPLVPIDRHDSMPVCDRCELGFPVVKKPRLPEAVRELTSPLMQALLPNAFLALVWKLGNKVARKRVMALSVAEVDDVGGLLLNLEFDEPNRVFRFVAERKQ